MQLYFVLNQLHMGFRMKKIVLFSLFTAFAPPATAQTITYDRRNQTVSAQMQVLAPHIGGRVQISDLPGDKPKAAVSYRHQWPGVYFETGFAGDKVVLKFDDAVNEYRLMIDALAPIAIAQPGQVEITIADLPEGKHRLRLEKVTESIWMLGAFQGFYADAAARPQPAPARPRQIEFIGDSDMTGYGLRSKATACSQDQVRLQSDTQAAYPALVAKHFDADYQINAVSGRGVVRNYEGMVPDHTLAAIYEQILPDEAADTTPYGDAAWRPQIIVIGLGNNDFATPLREGEAWLTQDALVDSYIAGMVALLKTLQGGAPNARLLIYWPDQGIMTIAEKARLDQDGQARLTQTARALGMPPLQFLTPGDLQLDGLACHNHGSAADNHKKAAWLIDWMTQQPQIWGGP